MNLRQLTAATLGVMAIGLSASAQAAIFNDRASFNAAVSTQTTVTFDGLIAPGFDARDDNATASINAVLFAYTRISIRSVGVTLLAATAHGSNFLEREGGPHVLTLTFEDGPITAFGFDFMEVRGHASVYTADVNDFTQSLHYTEIKRNNHD